MDVTCLYHERQRLSLCGVHAVNNLLQRPQFSQRDFEVVCESLVSTASSSSAGHQDSSMMWSSSRNPHRTWLIGNYDANVVTVIIQQEPGITVRWHDARQDLVLCDLNNSIEQAASDDDDSSSSSSTLLGILWNVPSASLWGRLTKGRHWIALLLHQETKQWINLDSNLAQPVLVGTEQACIDLLGSIPDAHILLVHKSMSNPKQHS